MKTLYYIYAPWCGPCQTLSPIMDEIQRRGIPVRKINADYEADLTLRYQVRSVPTVILVENEKEIRRFTGARSLQDILNFYNG